MNEDLYKTLEIIRDKNGIIKIAGETGQNYEEFNDFVLNVRELHKLGLVFFDERKAIRNGRNRKSEYLAIQCRIEYEGKKALNYGSF